MSYEQQIERAIERATRAARERGYLTEAEADYIIDAEVRIADLLAPADGAEGRE